MEESLSSATDDIFTSISRNNKKVIPRNIVPKEFSALITDSGVADTSSTGSEQVRNSPRDINIF